MLSGGRCDRTAGIIQHLGKTVNYPIYNSSTDYANFRLEKKCKDTQNLDDAKKLLSLDAAYLQLQLDVQKLFF
jgi:hypothetical protein